jgi:predicted phosphodiesterase
LPDPTTRILAIGDMHLGRTPAAVAGVAELGLGGDELGPAAAWRRAVDEALSRRVAAVLLAGDLVESANARFEAWGHLQRGIARLHAAAIPVVAVSGNHDVEVLPRLARHVPGLRLLGAGGQWESLRIDDGVGRPIRIVGWSHPRAPCPRSPLADPLPPPTGDRALTLGLLHADLDQPVSRYAPVARADLVATGHDAWLLGHIHKPSLDRRGDGPPVGYLGSLVGHDPTETGRRGPWLLTVGATGRLDLEHLPLAPLRWEEVHRDVSGWQDPAADLEGALLEALDAALAAQEAELPATGALGLTVRLGGSCRDFGALAAAVAARPRPVIPAGDGRPGAFLARLVDGSRPARDLAALARTADPAGLLARRLLALEKEDPALQPLLRAAAEAWSRRARTAPFAPLRLEPPAPAELREELLGAGYLALERLLAGKENPRAAG